MRIYKIAFRNPLDMATNILSRKLLQAVIKLTDQGRLNQRGNWIIETNAKYKGFGDEIKIVIHLNVVEKYMIPPFSINAQYSSLNLSPYALLTTNTEDISHNKKLEIWMNFSILFSKKFYNDLYGYIVNAIRHELEHMKQDEERMVRKHPKDYDANTLTTEKDLIKSFDERSKYLSSAFEQEPWIRGFMLQCKKEKVSLGDALIDFIHQTLFLNDTETEKRIKNVVGLKAEHIEQILYKLYMDRAKKIFPKMQ